MPLHCRAKAPVQPRNKKPEPLTGWRFSVRYVTEPTRAEMADAVMELLRSDPAAVMTALEEPS